MITDDEQLKQTQGYLSAMEAALADLKRQLAERHPERFRISAHAYVEEIRRARAEIDAYIGIPLAA